uniref:Protein farnesyltransferase/geranylgeranyltransferase type-1 subunit alpha n=1 Tax=Clastoptera arizonana TaxID=38151 RepID=A0A1B6C230_9HEMI
MNTQKNYQVWHHRRVVVEWLNDPEDELNITAEVLEIDAKNYHAWQHRQWVVHTFGLFENELDYVTKLLNEDVRNNSAWNQRYFVLSNISNFTANLIEKEIVYTISKIISVTKNESSWNYLRGLLLHSEHGLNHPITIKFCEELYDSGHRSPYLLAFLVDHAEEMIEKGDINKIKFLNLSLKLCKELGEEHDTIRQEYWKYLAKRIKESAQE